MLNRAEQNALKAQIKARLASPVETDFPVLEAKTNQVAGGYNPDAWEMDMLHKGDILKCIQLKAIEPR